MRISILSVCIAFFTCSSFLSLAQKDTVEIGLVTGVNYFMGTNTDWKGRLNSKVMPNIGVTYRRGLTKHFSIKTLFIYEKIASNEITDSWGVFPNLNDGAEITYYNERIFIPLLAHWSFGHKTKFGMYIGPSLSFDFNEKREINYGSYSQYYGSKDVDYEYKWTLGFDFYTPLNQKLVLHADVMGSAPFWYTPSERYELNGISTMVLIGVSYRFKLKRDDEPME